ncbi:Rieske 2Fe-2S domain-containing protein [Streptomyces sp. NPDC087440]|uniref:Rieske 2Fe-2S domain-containing protein n=1 Tax=Streptomyces sp. NPDC087440 TaxID=3365790 RepID=UPI0037F31C88
MRIHEYRSPLRAGSAAMDTPPLPYPQGWFCVGFVSDFKPGTVTTSLFMGEEIVIYRTRRGTIKVTRPYCPHLGAHLGAGGRVDGELLVCPFHHFAFGPDGTCERTPYGSPPRARLSLLPTREAFGITWVWHSHDNQPPTWELPDLPTSGRIPAHHATDMSGHPQDIVENVIDYGHLPVVHGIEPTVLAEPVAKEQTYHLTYELARPMPPLGTVINTINFTFIGLAGTHAKIQVADGLLTADAWVLVTPIGPWRVRIWYASSATIGFDQLPAPWHRLPRRPLEQTVTSLMNHWLVRDGRTDFPIYHHKTYLPHPKLNKGDGPIGALRKWARQFYPGGPITSPGQQQMPTASLATGTDSQAATADAAGQKN